MSSLKPMKSGGWRLEAGGQDPRRSTRAFRSGFTLIEILVVATLLVVVFTALTIVFSGGRRMNRAAQLTVAVNGALLIQEQLSIDLKQIGVRPGILGPVQIAPDGKSMAMYRTSFDGPAIRLKPVRYRLEPTRQGNFKLVREVFEGGSISRSRVIREVVIQSMSFREIIGRLGEGRYVVVTLTTLDDDIRPDQIGVQGHRRFSLMFLSKVPVPSNLGGAIISKTQNIVVEGPLPPL